MMVGKEVVMGWPTREEILEQLRNKFLGVPPGLCEAVADLHEGARDWSDQVELDQAKFEAVSGDVELARKCLSFLLVRDLVEERHVPVLGVIKPFSVGLAGGRVELTWARYQPDTSSTRR